MYKTYILQSEKDCSFYYGHSKDLDHRLDEHNSGRVRYTKARRPWKVYYFEVFETKSQAYRRELFFKSIEGYKFLRKSGIIKK
jgi:putative endonuclease